MNQVTINGGQFNTLLTQKLRLTKKEVCVMLSITSSKLEKYIKDDSSFPRPIKDGITRQAAVYFDTYELHEWWGSVKSKNKISHLEA
ncbi:hypothetical protein [Acinetobacter pittii]